MFLFTYLNFSFFFANNTHNVICNVFKETLTRQIFAAVNLIANYFFFFTGVISRVIKLVYAVLCVNATSGTISTKLRPRSWPATLPDFSSNEILMSCTTRLLDQEIFRLIGGYRLDNLVEYSYSIPEDTSYGLKLSFRETDPQ